MESTAGVDSCLSSIDPDSPVLLQSDVPLGQPSTMFFILLMSYLSSSCSAWETLCVKESSLDLNTVHLVSENHLEAGLDILIKYHYYNKTFLNSILQNLLNQLIMDAKMFPPPPYFAEYSTMP